MAKFGTFKFGEELFGGIDSGAPSDGGSFAIVRVPWIFQELHSGDQYEFAINPTEATMPAIEKTFTTQSTASGRQIIFQGHNKAQVMSFSGTILTKEHLDAMNSWSSRQNQVEIMDDLARRYWVYIKSFSPTRKYTPQYPWRHEFSCDAVVLDWGSV